MNVDLIWADDQYPKTIFDVIGEYAKIGKKPERKKVSASEIGKFVTKEV